MSLLFVACLLSAQVFAYVQSALGASPALIWPTSGIALAGLILGGVGLWPAILAAAFLAQLLKGATLFVAIGLALGATLQAVVAAWFLRKFGFVNSFSQVRDTLVFITIALFATAVGPALGTVTYALADFPVVQSTSTFIPWWIGQILSVLIITPLLIRWLPRVQFSRTPIEYVEAWFAIASVVFVSMLLYWTAYREIAEVPIVYLILVPLLWIALRIGPRFMTLALFLHAALALGGTILLVRSSDTATSLAPALLQTEIYIVMISSLFLLLVTVAEERKDTANDLRRNIQSLEEAVERIRKEDEAKSRFIATLAHELRNPLAPLMSSLEIMKLEQAENVRASMLAESMTTHLKTMRHLLDDLLDISRISKEKLSLQKEQVDLNAILVRSMGTVDGIMREREHTLTSSLPKEAILIEADPVRLEQVFVNLLNNAAKYTEPRGEITISAKTVGSEAVVTVSDTGIGMDAHLLEHVFEPFFQIDQPGMLRAGLGIGLSLSKNLVQMHGGSIVAESGGEGRGSTFIVRLPFHPTSTSTPNSVPRSMDTREGLRILVVDDNKAAADSLAKLLALRGNETEAVYTGESAIERAPEYAPDVILLDIGLPDIEGYDVARALTKDERVAATLIALTGYGQESDIRKAQKAGFTHHLTKPTGLAEIEEILSKIAKD